MFSCPQRKIRRILSSYVIVPIGLLSLAISFGLGISFHSIFFSSSADEVLLEVTPTASQDTFEETFKPEEPIESILPEPIISFEPSNVKSDTNLSVSSSSEYHMIEELLEALPTLEGETFAERYKEFEQKGYSLPSGTFYLNDDFTSSAKEEDYKDSLGNLVFKFEKERTCIGTHRESNLFQDFVVQFIFFDNMLVYKEGNTVIVEGVDESMDSPRIYRRFEIYHGSYKYQEFGNADVKDETTTIPMGTTKNGTLALCGSDFGLYYLGEKLCSVTLTQESSIEITPAIGYSHYRFVTSSDTNFFYNAPFICNGKLMCIQTYTASNGKPQIALHTLDTKVEKVIPCTYYNSYYINLYILQYQDGTYAVMGFNHNPIIYSGPVVANYPNDFAEEYMNSQFYSLTNDNLVKKPISFITKFKPETQIKNLHFEHQWLCRDELNGIELHFDLQLSGNSYEDICFKPADLHFGSLELSYDEAEAVLPSYCTPFAISEYDKKVAEIKDVLARLQKAPILDES